MIKPTFTKKRPLLLYALLVLGLLVPCLGNAQNHNALIRGEIRTNDQQPLAFASALLKDTRYGSMADENGIFQFQAPAGEYTLLVSYAGYIALEKKITLHSGVENNVGVLVVDAAAHQLREVVVADIQKNKFADKQTSTVARMALGDLENPQVYSVVNKDFMQEQLAIDFNSAIVSVPGVVVNNGVNDSGNDVTLRGFITNATFRNGLVVNPRTQTEIVNVERVEVLKGPSATLFGGAMSTYGGAVNTVTKRPFESFRGEIGYNTGSFGLNRFTADLNTPLNADRTALLRVNAAAHTQNSFQDQGYVRGTALAASMAFKTGKNTTIRFDADYYAPNKTLNAFVRNSNVLTVPSMSSLNNVHDRSFTSNDIGTKRTSYYALAEVEHRISDAWTSRTTYQHGESGEKQSIFLVLSYLDNKTVSRGIRPFDIYELITDNVQQNFVGDFKIGGVRNRLVVGGDFMARTTNYQYGSFNVGTAEKPRYSVFAPYDVVKLDDESPWAPISRDQVNKIDRAFTTGIQNSNFSFSAYASDAISLTDRLIVLASLRIDRYENQKSITNGVAGTDNYVQVQASPKLGVVFQPIKDQISLFGNYSNGFTNVAPSLNATTNTITTWKPTQAFQTEGGVKFDLWNGILSSTISYYDIRVKDLVRSIPDGTSVQDGNQRSRGLEVEVIANPARGLNIVAGYGYNDNKYTLYNEAYQNKTTPWVPAQVFNTWISYKLLNGPGKGLGFGAGGNYAGKTYLDISNTFTVPAYTLLNATVFYDQPKYRIGLKVNNLADKSYWNFYGQPQNPRQFLVGVSYKF